MRHAFNARVLEVNYPLLSTSSTIEYICFVALKQPMMTLKRVNLIMPHNPNFMNEIKDL